MHAFEAELERRLQALEAAELRRRLRRVNSPQGRDIEVEGKRVLNFSSNDYLGLTSYSKLKAAAIEATERFGTGSGASRLICGSLQPHHVLEQALADFKQTEAALVFSTGYATAVGTIAALMGPSDFVIIDRLVHASIVDGARLSGAKLRVFAHNDLNELEAILKWCDIKRKADSKILVVSESVFSMDGDFAPLCELVALKEKFGAWLMVDEAHATGLFGERRTGLCEQFGVSDRVEIQMGTLGKAVGSAGGYIAGRRSLVEYLLNKARSFVFSTAPPPAISAAAHAGIELIRSSDGARAVEKLRGNIARFNAGMESPAASENSPIFPLIIGAETAAVKFSKTLLDQGVFVPAIRYPTVPRGKARLRFTFSAAHSENDLSHAIEAVRRVEEVIPLCS